MIDKKCFKINSESILATIQFFASLGGSIYELAISFYTIAYFKDLEVFGTALGLSFLPRILFSPLIGLVIDYFPKRKLLLGAYSIRIFSVIFLSMMIYCGKCSANDLYLVSILNGFVELITKPLIKCLVLQMVDAKRVVKANSLVRITEYCGEILGCSVCGFAYSKISPHLFFLLNAFMYLVSFTIFMISGKLKESRMKLVHNPFSRHTIVKKIDCLKDLSFIGVSSIGLFLVCLKTVSFSIILKIFQSNSQLGMANYGHVLSVYTLGSILGLFFILYKKDATSKWTLRSFLLGIFISILTIQFTLISENLFLIGLLFFMFGIFFSVTNILGGAAIALWAPEDAKGVVLSVFSSFNALSKAAAFFIISHVGNLDKSINYLSMAYLFFLIYVFFLAKRESLTSLFNSFGDCDERSRC